MSPTKDTNLAIWVIGSDGMNPRPLTDGAMLSCTHGEWSRQQTHVVFSGRDMGIGMIDVSG